jgi:hypothetical protein
MDMCSRRNISEHFAMQIFVNLRRFAGVSEAGARSRNPEERSDKGSAFPSFVSRVSLVSFVVCLSNFAVPHFGFSSVSFVRPLCPLWFAFLISQFRTWIVESAIFIGSPIAGRQLCSRSGRQTRNHSKFF